MRYIISYDLKNANPEDYDRLYDELKNMNAKRVLFSQWVVRAAETTPWALGERLLPYLTTGSGMLITCLDSTEFECWCPEVDPRNV